MTTVTKGWIFRRECCEGIAEKGAFSSGRGISWVWTQSKASLSAVRGNSRRKLNPVVSFSQWVTALKCDDLPFVGKAEVVVGVCVGVMLRVPVVCVCVCCLGGALVARRNQLENSFEWRGDDCNLRQKSDQGPIHAGRQSNLAEIQTNLLMLLPCCAETPIESNVFQHLSLVWTGPTEGLASLSWASRIKLQTFCVRF